MKLSYSK